MKMPSFLWPVARAGLQAYWRLQRPVTAGVRGLVRDDLGRVLLIRHTYVPGWYFPGGGVEKQETMREALVRELDEEVGVLVEGSPTLFGIYANFREFKSDHVALYCVTSYRMEPRRSPEIAEFGFFAMDDLPAEISAGTRRRLAEVTGDCPPSDHW